MRFPLVLTGTDGTFVVCTMIVSVSILIIPLGTKLLC